MIRAEKARELLDVNGKLKQKIYKFIEGEIKKVARDQQYVDIELTSRWYVGTMFSAFENESNIVEVTREVIKGLEEFGYSTRVEFESYGTERKDGVGILKVLWQKNNEIEGEKHD